MVKFIILLVVVVFDGVFCGTLLGGHETLSFGGGGGDDYGGSSFGAGSYSGLESAGGDSLQQAGGDGDYHHGTSVVGGGQAPQGQTLDLTDGGGHQGIFGGSFISAGVGGKSGQHAEEGGHEGLGAYAGASSYDVGEHGSEIAGVLSSSVHDIPIEALHYHH
ncbi:keratin, type I cytoskeletal 10-like [Onthophagus taurus]|uniref:keratin, type I cytoskeletal 10-like n=1 Tax=Onthophagus taurus TaxID=166361 RepID=UPI000C202291|nr:keratin, type I cytoskeletal 10-like [Onthophagus taurus]